jgi:hypothetical protein
MRIFLQTIDSECYYFGLADVGGVDEGVVAFVVGVEGEDLVVATGEENSSVIVEAPNIPLVRVNDSRELVH